jgi:hypothetical protein
MHLMAVTVETSGCFFLQEGGRAQDRQIGVVEVESA